jgi:DNA-binding FadR family transcriptional regulator
MIVCLRETLMEPALVRPRLTEQVAEHLTRLIADGDWPAGTVLPPEGDLAQQFGVSRTVIRECVRVLASRGMVEVRQGRGTSVQPPAAWNVTEPLALLVRADRADLLHWLEVRTILEVESAGLAAQRAEPASHRALQEALAHLELASDNADAFIAADVEFHLGIAQATGNPALLRLLRPVVQPLRQQLHDTALWPEAQRAANHEHRRILSCIAAGDAPGARAAMGGHLARVAEEIAAILSAAES